jgi:hypothetical protein
LITRWVGACRSPVGEGVPFDQEGGGRATRFQQHFIEGQNIAVTVWNLHAESIGEPSIGVALAETRRPSRALPLFIEGFTNATRSNSVFWL